MIIKDIVIKLIGRYDIDKLTQLNFKKVPYRNNRYSYRLIGKVYKYTFTSIDDKNIKLVIKAVDNKNYPYADYKALEDIWLSVLDKTMDLIQIKEV